LAPSLKSTTCPCLQPDKSSPCHPDLFLNTYFGLILPLVPRSSKTTL
jgi:hypothetical protein